MSARTRSMIRKALAVAVALVALNYLAGWILIRWFASPPVIVPLHSERGPWPEPADGWPAPHVGCNDEPAIRWTRYSAAAFRSARGLVLWETGTRGPSPEFTRQLDRVEAGYPFRSVRFDVRSDASSVTNVAWEQTASHPATD